MNEWLQLAIALQTIRAIDEQVTLVALGLNPDTATALRQNVISAQETMAQQQKDFPIDLAFELGLDV